MKGVGPYFCKTLAPLLFGHVSIVRVPQGTVLQVTALGRNEAGLKRNEKKFCLPMDSNGKINPSLHITHCQHHSARFRGDYVASTRQELGL